LVAQVESPKATIFGGYSYLRNNSNGFNGWTGQGTYNFTRNFGLTADFAGNYRTLDSATILGFGASTNQHMYTYMFGPTATAYFGKSSIFAHALFGQAHSSLGAGVSIPIIGGISTGVRSANAFAMAFGGGLDIGVSKHFAIRAAQVDYLQTRFSPTDALTTGLSSSVNDRQNSLRYQAGIVFRF
jgi:cytochrome oxidase assembly protein ShyY1